METLAPAQASSMGTQRQAAGCAKSTAVRMKDFPSAFLSVLLSAPPDFPSSPATLPARFEVADVAQNPWLPHPEDPAVLPTVNDR